MSESGTRRLFPGGASALTLWTADERRSVRAYHFRAEGAVGFCVPSYSSELTLVLDGELWIEMGPVAQSYRLLPGEACVVLRGTPHRTWFAADTRLLIFDVDLGGCAAGALGVLPVPGRALRGSRDATLADIWSHGLQPKLDLGAGIVERIGTVKGLYGFELGHNTRRLLAVKEHLERAFTGPLNMSEVARAHGLNPFYMLRSFKQNFGTTPLAYVQFLRQERFLWSVLRPVSSGRLIDLAGDAGFGDYATFCRNIRRRLGRPPSQLLRDPL